MLKWFAVFIVILITAQVEALPADTTPWAIPLNGPWKFQKGDSLLWISPSFNDANWRKVDLTPAPGATDGDVGLLGYVPGWGDFLHETYWGYAWYRLAMVLTPAQAKDLVITGPASVDDIYQVYVNQEYLGGIGDFSGATPSVYAIRPAMYKVPPGLLETDSAGNINVFIAFRVWVSRRTIAEDPSAGGIHIAPWIGNREGIAERNRFEWKQTFWGYVVDALEPLLFLCLAILAFYKGRATRWMAISCILTALVRVQQVLYYWTPWESLHGYYLWKDVVLTPLELMAWVFAWFDWFMYRSGKQRPYTAVVFWMISVVLLWFMGAERYTTDGPGEKGDYYKFGFLALILWWTLQGVIRFGWKKTLASVIAVLLICTGLFAAQLSAMHIPGIWFPFGVGVSRTQFAYAAYIPLMAILLIRCKEVPLQKPYLYVK